MAYDAPTAAYLKARYPAFADVDDALIDVYVTDAVSSAVDASWREVDYQPAAAAFAAHRLASLGIGAHGQAADFARQGVANFRSGNFQVGFSADRAGAIARGELDATPYGQEYARLLRINRGGPRIVNGPTV